MLTKGKIFFQFYRQQKCNMLCLVDTHFTEEMEQDIRNKWGYEACFNSIFSKSRWVAIFFKNNSDFKIHEQFKVENKGNLLALSISIEKRKLSLICLYRPNEDTTEFYQNLSNIVNKLQNDEMIIVGDFNLVLNTSQDYYNYLHVNNPKAREIVLEHIMSYSLVDIHREFIHMTRGMLWENLHLLNKHAWPFFLFQLHL